MTVVAGRTGHGRQTDSIVGLPSSGSVAKKARSCSRIRAESKPQSRPISLATSDNDRPPSINEITLPAKTDFRPSATSCGVNGMGRLASEIQGGVSSGDANALASATLRAANQNTVSIRLDPLTGESK